MPVCRCKSRRGLNEHLLERRPQAKNTVVRRQVPAQRAMALLRVAVEAYVLGQEMLEGLKQLTVPTGSGEKRPEHPLKSAVLVARKAQGPGDLVCRLLLEKK